MAVARRDAATRGAPPPPTALRPVLGFTKRLPTRAQRSVLSALATDAAFRGRVAEQSDEAQLGRASWLFLTRPEGWTDELARLADAAAEEQRDTDAARSEVAAVRRAEQLADSVERLRSELAAERREREHAEAELTRVRAEAQATVSSRDELAARVDQLERERARAVRELKAAEATATSRLEQLRAEQEQLAPLREQVTELEAALEARTRPESESESEPTDRPAGPPPDGWSDDERAMVARSVERAARAAQELSCALGDAASGLLRPAPPVAPLDAPVEPPPATSQRPSRRVPVRLRGGVHDGSPEGLRQLLDVAGMVAVIDGYNVTMEGWPNLDRERQRTSLVAGLGGLQAQVPANIHVVFDGDADGRRPSVAAPLPVRVHFSPADTEADDVILSMVAGLSTDTPVLVVSTDRRVAEGARRLGANAVQSSVLLELLRR